MQKPTTYQQLQPEDRITIATMRQRGFSVRAIARTLERAPSTIAREVARNTSAGQSYGSHHAQLRAVACRRSAHGNGKLHGQSVCWGVVRTMLGWKWSPQQISATLKRVVRHEVAYMIVSPVRRKEEKPAVSSAVVYRRMRSWQRLGVKLPGQRNLLIRAASILRRRDAFCQRQGG